MFITFLFLWTGQQNIRELAEELPVAHQDAYTFFTLTNLHILRWVNGQFQEFPPILSKFIWTYALQLVTGYNPNGRIQVRSWNEMFLKSMIASRAMVYRPRRHILAFLSSMSRKRTDLATVVIDLVSRILRM